MLKGTLNVSRSRRSDLLDSFISSVPASSRPVRARYPSSSTKSGPIYKSVRDVIAASQDAEISGSGDAHQITDELKDGHLFKRKLLQFREDTRPAYFGQSPPRRARLKGGLKDLTLNLTLTLWDWYCRHVDPVKHDCRPANAVRAGCVVLRLRIRLWLRLGGGRRGRRGPLGRRRVAEEEVRQRNHGRRGADGFRFGRRRFRRGRL